MSDRGIDPRMQREAVNIATSLLEALACQDRGRVEAGLAKLATADGAKNFTGLAQVLSDYLATRGRLDSQAMADLARRLRVALGESPLTSLLAQWETTHP